MLCPAALLIGHLRNAPARAGGRRLKNNFRRHPGWHPYQIWLAEGVRLAAETAHELPLAASIATGREFSNLIWGCHGDEGGFLAVLPRLRPVWMTPAAISPTSAVATIGCSFLCVMQRGPSDINRIYRLNRQGAAGTQTFGWGARTPILVDATIPRVVA